MKSRTPFQKADAIFSGDWHLREDQPVCRIDEHWDVQWYKVGFIRKLQEENNCPVYLSGDLFNHWKPSPYLLSRTIQEIPRNTHTIYGNHDLPQHNLDLQNKSGLYNLVTAGAVTLLNGAHWGQEPGTQHTIDIKGRKMLIWHVMTYQGKKPWPGCEDPKGSRLLKKYPEYDLILTGHNHKPFIAEHKGRVLVNPGSILRQSADQIKATPRVYLYYADSNTVEEVFLPIANNVITREHIEVSEKRSKRIDAFISKLNTKYKNSLDFEENLEQYFSENPTKKSIKQIIYKSIGK